MVKQYNDKAHLLTLDQLFPAWSLPSEVAALPVTQLHTDSRHVEPGDIFVAVPGVKTHGEQFIAQAIAAGAAAVLLEAVSNCIRYQQRVPVLSVPYLSQRLSQIAGELYGHPSQTMSVIAVTGTNGKTSCVQWLAQAMASLGDLAATVGTLGYGVMHPSGAATGHPPAVVTGMTTPDAIQTQSIFAQLAQQHVRRVAIEVSSHGLAQHRVDGIDIETAVFTNLTQDHLDYHGNMQSYGEAKARLFSLPTIKNLVLNQDDAFTTTIISHMPAGAALYTYSLKDTHSQAGQARGHFSFRNIQSTQQGVNAALLSPEGVLPVTIPVIGNFNLSNVLAVIAALYASEFPLNAIVRAIEQLHPVVGRMELIANTLGLQVIVDYAHTPDALHNLLATLKPHCQQKLWCVFGCGGDRDTRKRPQMAAIAEQLADHVIVTNDNPRRESPEKIIADIVQGFAHPRYQVVMDRAQAIAQAIAEATSGDVIVIAGKGHEDYQLIGEQRLHFSDQQHAREQLRDREQRQLA
ncbi:MAG: UDP-N-acetylmuramoyl-L-alanyl-D-glutamate--2,6-diaminopimelate ligase [Cellvibrionaceae bacterium]|nr:UDP-N-acetylmuramoyl-L-alanyl-D-glutamate--2,6-diaminopimelate ligase [Cellvibrionaceae bacterium]